MCDHTNKGGTAISRPLHSFCAEGVFVMELEHRKQSPGFAEAEKESV